MKNPNLVIDVGQTFIKFVVINNKYQVVDHIVLNNKLLFNIIWSIILKLSSITTNLIKV